jgi:hypothetical protein
VGSGVVLTMVGPKAAASPASVVGGPASALPGGERGHGRKTDTVIDAAMMSKAIKTHNHRRVVEWAGGGPDVVRFFRFIETLAHRDCLVTPPAVL